jgi:hypothetical protein
LLVQFASYAKPYLSLAMSLASIERDISFALLIAGGKK